MGPGSAEVQAPRPLGLSCPWRLKLLSRMTEVPAWNSSYLGDALGGRPKGPSGMRRWWAFALGPPHMGSNGTEGAEEPTDKLIWVACLG